MFELVILIVLIFTSSVFVIYYLFFWTKFVLYKQHKAIENRSNLPVSVIICAKNEEFNLKNNLPSILNQDYTEFEVVVVDDGSDDDTFYLLKNFQNQYSNLNVIRLHENRNFFKGKKFPLSIGIRSAKYKHLVLTDADCRAVSKNWLNSIASCFSEEKKIVLGYGKIASKPALLNYFIRFETLHTAIQYFSLALRKIPYMGVGRNLAYTKELFEQSKGFSKHYNVISGDDDLFINEVANNSNTAICIDKGSFTISSSKARLKDWFIQKRRHFSSSKIYKTKHKLLLASYSFLVLCFYVSFILSIFFSYNIILSLAFFSLKTLMFVFLINRASKKLDEKNLWQFSVIFEMFIVIYSIIIFISNFVHKPDKWK